MHNLLGVYCFLEIPTYHFFSYIVLERASDPGEELHAVKYNACMHGRSESQSQCGACKMVRIDDYASSILLKCETMQ